MVFVLGDIRTPVNPNYNTMRNVFKGIPELQVNEKFYMLRFSTDYNQQVNILIPKDSEECSKFEDWLNVPGGRDKHELKLKTVEYMTKVMRPINWILLLEQEATNAYKDGVHSICQDIRDIISNR